MKTGEIAVKGQLINCCFDCPFRGSVGGPGPVMVCEHPVFEWADKVARNKNEYFSPYNAAILSNVEYKSGYPDLCPLFNGGSKL